VKYWLAKAATFAIVAAVVAGCGGGSGGEAAGAAGGPAPAAVDVPARVDRVDAYERPAASLALKREVFTDPAIRPTATVVRLSRLDAAQAAPGKAQPGRPLQIGTGRDIAQAADPQKMRGLLQFKPGANGAGPAAAVSFTSPGASGLRLGLRIDELPAAARVRGYAQGGATAFDLTGTEILAAVKRNRDAGDLSDKGRTYWTPVVEGEEATLEIALPQGASADTVKVSVPMLSHVAVKASELATLMIGQAASCEVDISCSADATSQSRATARMIFVDGGFSYACTGTLLNDTRSSGTAWFLSAEHCIGSQTAASSMVTYWSYKSASCNAQVLDSKMTPLTAGATLLYSSTYTDTSFMQLNAKPPDSAVFAGWSASPPQFGVELVGVHHPRGDLQKISRGLLAGFLSCTVGLTDSFACREASITGSNFLNTTWSSGTVESGSSGSGLFTSINGSRYLVGQLKGGDASCSDPTGLNAYGRFDLAYNAALARWLSPGGAVALGSQSASASTPRVPVYRFYNFATGSHFYTPVGAERDYVLANLPTYAYEGVAFYAYNVQVPGSSAVYRFYNRDTRRHFYTISKPEHDYVVATFPQFVDEGVSWFAQAGSGGTAIPVYRFYAAIKNAHFYTASEADRAFVLQNIPQYAPEGVGFYAWGTQ
jgi:hypothetical protein